MSDSAATISTTGPYTQALRQAVHVYRQLCARSDWELVTTRAVGKPSSSKVQLWKSAGAYKVTLANEPSWPLAYWRSLLETATWHTMVKHKQVMQTLDKHAHVSRVTMDDAWQLGEKERTMVEQVHQHGSTLRYVSGGVGNDDNEALQVLCLSIDLTLQAMHDDHVIIYCQTVEKFMDGNDGDTLGMYLVDVLTHALTTLLQNGPAPYVSKHDDAIRVDSHKYEAPLYELRYRFVTDAHTSTSATSQNVRIHPVSPTTHASSTTSTSAVAAAAVAAGFGGSRSWDQRPTSSMTAMPDLRSSSLAFRPSSPGFGQRAMFMTLSGRNGSHTNLSVPPSSSSVALASSPSQPIMHVGSGSPSSSPLSSSLPPNGPGNALEGQQLVIELQGRTWANGQIQLSVQLFENDEKEMEDPTLIDLFAQLCVRCFHRPQLMNSELYTLVLQHPLSLLDDMDLPHLASLGVRIVLRHVASDPPERLQLFLYGRPWPIRRIHQWDRPLEDDDSDSDDALFNDKDDKDEKDDKDDSDPFVDSMEDLHDQNTPSSPPLIQSSEPPKPIAIASSSEKSAATTASSPPPAAASTSTSTSSSAVPPNASSVPTSPNLKQKRPLSMGKKITVPHVDPAKMTDAYTYFDTLLHSTTWKITRQPDATNGHATLHHMDVDGHPTGASLCESYWHHCSIWDAKAVIVCPEAREIWDSMFDKGDLIGSITPTCSIWHHKLKGAWPASPRDYVVFISEYNSAQRVDICATSCPDDETYEHFALPRTTSDYVRAVLDVAGWRLDRVDGKKKGSTSVFVRYALQTHFQGWIPWYLANQLTTQAPTVPTAAYAYVKKYGAPPCLEKLQLATVHQQSYDHTRKHWRCEYTRSIEDEHSAMPSTSLIRLDRRRWASLASDPTSNAYNITIDPPPSRVHAEFRKDDDPYGVWLHIEHNEAAIIPRRANILVLIKPDTRQRSISSMNLLSPTQKPVDASASSLDPFEIKKKRHRTVTLVINGDATPIQDDVAMEEAAAVDDDQDQTPIPQQSPLASPTLSATLDKKDKGKDKKKGIDDNDDQVTTTLEEWIAQLPVSPLDQAQAAFVFLKRMDEELFGWTMLSDKHGLRTSKRPGVKNTANHVKKIAAKKVSMSLDTIDEASSSASPSPSPLAAASSSKLLQAAHAAQSVSTSSSSSSLAVSPSPDRTVIEDLQVPDPYMIYKSTKVIENFSMDEVASVVTNVSQARKDYDHSIDATESLTTMERGCQVIRQEIKSMFPFKSRELFMTSCTAIENVSSGSSTKRCLYVESSLEMSGKNMAFSKAPALARGRVFISGWILEPIDPYTTTTNHPIPSMRATYIVALDLGPSIPSYISNMIANGIATKKIQWVEQHLKEKGPLPYLVHPLPAVGLRRNQVVPMEALDELSQLPLPASGDDASLSSSSTLDRHDAVLLFSPRSSLKWRQVTQEITNHDALTIECQCQYQPPKPVTIRATPAAIIHSPPIHPTASQSASWMDRRSSTTYSAPNSSSSAFYGQRRGSLPSANHISVSPRRHPSSLSPSASPNATATATADSNASSLAPVDPVLCELIVELQAFPAGYDVQAQFSTQRAAKDGQPAMLDLSSLLAMVISELAPSPSQLLLASKEASSKKAKEANKSSSSSSAPLLPPPPPGKKHRIQVKLLASTLSQTVFQPQDNEVYTLKVSLKPYEPLPGQAAQQQLTMSGLFADDDDDDDNESGNVTNKTAKSIKNWPGAHVDGERVTQYDQDIKLTNKPIDLASLNTPPPPSLPQTPGAKDPDTQTLASASTAASSSIDPSLPATSDAASRSLVTSRDSSMHHHHHHSRQSSSASSASVFSTASIDATAQNDMLDDNNGVSMNLTKMLTPFLSPFSSLQKNDTQLQAPGLDGIVDALAANSEKQDGDAASSGMAPVSVAAPATMVAVDTASPSSSPTTATTLTSVMIRRRWAFICGILFALFAIYILTLLFMHPQQLHPDTRQPIYSLCRFPWFGGWEVQLILNRKQAL